MVVKNTGKPTLQPANLGEGAPVRPRAVEKKPASGAEAGSSFARDAAPFDATKRPVVGAAGPNDLVGLRASGGDLGIAITGSPLAQGISELKVLAGDNPQALQQLGAALSGLLGVEVPDLLTDVSIDDLVRGELQLSLNLVDADYSIPYGKGAIDFEIPKDKLGTRVTVDVKLGKAPANQNGQIKGEPIIESVKLGFTDANGDALKKSHLPRINNPTALEPSDNKFLDAIKDMAADVQFRGMTMNAAGEVHIDADVAILGQLIHQDFHKLASPSIPTLNTSVRQLAGGEPIRIAAPADQEKAQNGASAPAPGGPPPPAGPAPATPAPGGPAAPPEAPPEPFGIATMIKSFASVASEGSWKLKLLAKADNEPVGLVSSGTLLATEASDIKGNVKVAVRAAGDRMTLRLQGENAYKPDAEGTLNINLKVTNDGQTQKDYASLGVSWNGDGMYSQHIDANKVAPLDLKPWNKAKAAPKAGSAAFRNRLSDLLNKDAPVSTGNILRPVASGHDVLTETLDQIKSAGPDDVVLLQTFIFKDDVTGSQIVDELIAARARGADVFVLIDTVGSAGDADQMVNGGPAYQRLAKGGVDVQLHNKPTELLGGMVDAVEFIRENPEVEKHINELYPRFGSMIDAVQAQGGVEALLANPALIANVTIPMAMAVAEMRGVDVENSPPEIAPLVAALAPIAKAIDGDNDAEDLQALTEHLVNDLSRDHRKVSAVYSKKEAAEIKAKFMLGGNNLADDYLLEPDCPNFNPEEHGKLWLWNDEHVAGEGAGAMESIVAGFQRGWAESGAESVIPNSPKNTADSNAGAAVRIVNHFPIAATEAQGDNHFTNTMLIALEGLSKGDEMVIQNPYFLPVPELKQAMLDAGDRGAKLTIYSNGPNKNNDAKIISEQSRQFILPDLLENKNIKFHETLPDSQPIHRKTMVMRTKGGEQMYIVGSQNMDRLSAGINREMFMMGGSATSKQGNRVDNDKVANGLWQDARRDADAGYSKQIKLEELELNLEQRIQGLETSLIRPLL